MIRTTAGRLFLNELLPPDLRDYQRVLNKPGAEQLFEELARRHPDQYGDVSHRLVRLAGEAVTQTQRSAFRPRDFFKAQSAKTLHQKIKDEIRPILADDTLDDKAREQAILRVLSKYQQPMLDQVMQESRRERNPFAWQIDSGARGSPVHVNLLRGSPLLYVDHHERLIPLPVLNSFGDGLTSMEFLASSYGARRGMVAAKLMVQDAGFLGKQLNQVAHRMVVADLDGPEPSKPRGWVVPLTDPDNEGALLAVPAGKYPRNTILTPEVIRDLLAKGYTKVMIRTPLVGGTPDGGLYALDVGLRETGRLPRIGDMVGLQAAQSISEPVSQGQLCLAADTPVRMADGSVKRIAEIQPGEQVLGADRTGKTFPVAVKAVYDNGTRYCYRAGFDALAHRTRVWLEATFEHKVLGFAGRVGGQTGEPALYPLAYVTRALLADGSTAILDLMESVGQRPTFDLEVDHPDHLFVLANGLIVSNSARHVGGVAGQEKMVSGFTAINQLFQVPEKLQSGAAHATRDGLVNSVQPARLGGHYVFIDNVKHYVAPHLNVTVKPGDQVEAGDPISDGVPHPATLVQYKGIGEGRRQFVELLRKTLEASGAKVHRRHLEIMARALINHVVVTKPWEDFLPDDVIPYSTIEHLYQPREDSKELSIHNAEGMYLEEPVLHYTIGTRLTPRVLKDLEEAGVEKVRVHREPPPFEPVMIRAMETLRHDPDWMTRLYGSYLQSGLLEAVHRGLVSDEEGTSFVPSLARAQRFGHVGPFRKRSAQETKPNFGPPMRRVPDTTKSSLPEPPSQWGGWGDSPLFSGLRTMLTPMMGQLAQNAPPLASALLPLLAEPAAAGALVRGEEGGYFGRNYYLGATQPAFTGQFSSHLPSGAAGAGQPATPPTAPAFSSPPPGAVPNPASGYDFAYPAGDRPPAYYSVPAAPPAPARPAPPAPSPTPATPPPGSPPPSSTSGTSVAPAPSQSYQLGQRATWSPAEVASDGSLRAPRHTAFVLDPAQYARQMRQRRGELPSDEELQRNQEFYEQHKTWVPWATGITAGIGATALTWPLGWFSAGLTGLDVGSATYEATRQYMDWAGRPESYTDLQVPAKAWAAVNPFAEERPDLKSARTQFLQREQLLGILQRRRQEQEAVYKRIQEGVKAIDQAYREYVRDPTWQSWANLWWKRISEPISYTTERAMDVAPRFLFETPPMRAGTIQALEPDWASRNYDPSYFDPHVTQWQAMANSLDEILAGVSPEMRSQFLSSQGTVPVRTTWKGEEIVLDQDFFDEYQLAHAHLSTLKQLQEMAKTQQTYLLNPEFESTYELLRRVSDTSQERKKLERSFAPTRPYMKW